MVKIVASTCPRCGANVELPTDLRKAHCVYCGASIIIAADGSQKAECRICDGFGRLEKCRACDGTGKCRWSKYLDKLMLHKNAELVLQGEAHCEDGKCSACRGSGKGSLGLPCPFCDGTGVCPQCLGTGSCAACRGVGNSPNPRGSEVCYLCGGDGVVDIEKANIRWSERCSVCKATLTTDGCFCSHCGHARRCPKCGKDWSDQKVASCPSCGFERGTKP